MDDIVGRKAGFARFVYAFVEGQVFCPQIKLISARIVEIRVWGYPLSLRCVLKCETAVLNVVSEEFVQRSLSASPSMKPLLTPGGWELE